MSLARLFGCICKKRRREFLLPIATSWRSFFDYRYGVEDLMSHTFMNIFLILICTEEFLPEYIFFRLRRNFRILGKKIMQVPTQANKTSFKNVFSNIKRRNNRKWNNNNDEETVKSEYIPIISLTKNLFIYSGTYMSFLPAQLQSWNQLFHFLYRLYGVRRYALVWYKVVMRGSIVLRFFTI